MSIAQTKLEGMVMRILSLLIFLLFVASLGMAETGYRSDPWGSNTWVGPGRPPHWSTPETDKAPSRRDSMKKKGYHRQDTSIHHYPFYKHKRSRNIIIYRQEPEEPVVIQKTIIKTRQIPVLKRSSPIRCGGDTVYLKDKNTGEPIIQYVSPAQKC